MGAQADDGLLEGERNQLVGLLSYLGLPVRELVYLDETWHGRLYQLMNETAGAPGGKGISAAEARRMVLGAECCAVEDALNRACFARRAGRDRAKR